MPSLHKRAYSRYTSEALALMGKQIRLGRKERRWTAQELAERVGVSRGTIQRIEKGDPKVEIGVMFEAASLVGLKLFDADYSGIRVRIGEVDARIAVLPKHVYPTNRDTDDDF